MSTAADTFAAFVAVVAEAIAAPSGDEATLDGDRIAGRLHLSRFHLDRVVSAVAGEPPARFRRRILLERAAYRLVSSARTILDIATEAGYGSHEAFTRAFTRAYGVSPAAWRAAPGRLRLPASSGVHFQPPGTLRLPAEKKVSSMELLTRMVEHHVWLVGEMLSCAAKLSDEQLDQVIELSVDDDRQTTRSLLSRLIGQMDMWNCALAGRDYDWSLEEHETPTSMRRRLADAGPAYLGHVREVCEQGRLDDTFVDALCEPPEVFTYGGMIAHVLTFAAHRRTLVVLALAAAGVKDLGWGDPMRWVADPAAV